MKRSYGIAIAVAAVVLALVLGKVFGLETTRSGLRVGYAGTESSKKWTAAYVLFDGSMRRSLRPSSETDVLNIDVETASGTLAITVTDSNRAVLYENPDMGTQSLSLEIPGKVTVTLNGSQHKGSFRITCGARAGEAP